jgi:enoyl-CoA hydratase/carnithine racemase
MAKVEYELDGRVAVVTMNSGENRFNFPFFDAFLEILDEIEQKTETNALVVRSADPKIWSNGIDLDWLLPAIEKEGPELMDRFREEMYAFMKRVLTYPMPTIAAINGHAFAGGAFLAFAHDFRFMRSDKGWICLPEVDLNMTLGPVFSAIARRAVPLYKFEEMQYTGKRLTARECEEHHIIMKACPPDDLMNEALAFARLLNKDGNLIGRMKVETHQEILEVIDQALASPPR